MRRSNRLMMQTQIGGVKRKAQEETVKASETSNNLASAVRRRGLFQDPPAEENTIITQDTFIVAEHIPSSLGPVPPSPFSMEQIAGQDLSPPPLNDENTPPRKRRYVVDTDVDPEIPADDEIGARANSHQLSDPAEGAAAVETTISEPATWFTPIRPTRPPVVEPEFTPTGMPSRMPSFALWIDGMEVPEEETAPHAAAPPAAPVPPTAKSNGGVDMTDLARLYDPQIAAAAGKSPPTPIEKICKSLTS